MQPALFIDTITPDPPGNEQYPARVEIGTRRGQGATFSGLASTAELGQANCKIYMPPATYDVAGNATPISIVPEAHITDQKGREFLLVGEALPASGRSAVDHLELSCQALASDQFTIYRATGATVDSDGVSAETYSKVAGPMSGTWVLVRDTEAEIGGARGEVMAAIAVLKLPVDVELNDRVVVDVSPGYASATGWTVVKREMWRNHVRLFLRSAEVVTDEAAA